MIRRALLPLAVAVLTAACFLPALSGAFLNWDDGVNFLENRAYRGLGREQIRWAFTSVLFGHYIPLTRLTFSVNYILGGNPWGYHLGTALIVQGRYAEAESPLRNYIERVPRSAAGPERLGRAYLLQSRYEEAIPLLRTALNQQPDTPGLRDYLIQSLEGRARELHAKGLGPQAEPLLAESRALGQQDAGRP